MLHFFSSLSFLLSFASIPVCSLSPFLILSIYHFPIFPTLLAPSLFVMLHISLSFPPPYSIISLHPLSFPSAFFSLTFFHLHLNPVHSSLSLSFHSFLFNPSLFVSLSLHLCLLILLHRSVHCALPLSLCQSDRLQMRLTG